MRTIGQLVTIIRERLQEPGPDGGGYTDQFIREALWSAAINLSEVAPIEGTATFETTAATNIYDLTDEVPGTNIISIFKVKYDGKWLEYVPRNDYFEIGSPTEGFVTRWSLWGDAFILVGEVEAEKNVELYLTKTPAKFLNDGDIHGLPEYAEEALIHYTVAQCYQITRDYDRSTLHFNIFQAEKNLVTRRMSSAQTESIVAVSDDYWGPHVRSW